MTRFEAFLWCLIFVGAAVTGLSLGAGRTHTSAEALAARAQAEAASARRAPVLTLARNSLERDPNWDRERSLLDELLDYDSEEFTTFVSFLDNLPNRIERESFSLLALRLWHTLEPGKVRNYCEDRAAAGYPSLLRVIVEDWAAADPAAAQVYVAALPHGGLRAHAHVGLLAGLAHRDPAQVAARATASPPSSAPFQSGAELARRWAAVDAPEVGRWLTDLSPLSPPYEALPEIAARWLAVAPETFESWLQSLPLTEVRRRAVSGYAAACAPPP